MAMSKPSDNQGCPSYGDIALDTLNGALAGGAAGVATVAIYASSPGAIVFGIEGAVGGAVYEATSGLLNKLECEYGQDANHKSAQGW